MKEYLKRPLDVLNALRSMGRAGFSVSLPHQAADGEMFFKIDGYELTVAQILELMDKNALDLVGIRHSGVKREKDASVAAERESVRVSIAHSFGS